MKPLNVLSLFDGMSCGRVALERAGIPVANYFASEIDRYAIQIAMKNYPDTIQLGDVNGWANWNLPKIDLLIGGSPCQGFSNAGTKLNFDDPRSKLFFVYVEILHSLKRKNPDIIFLLENVKMRIDWMEIITRYLETEPVIINSALVSAQNRERVYWSNLQIVQPDDRGIHLKDILEPDPVRSLWLSQRERIYMDRTVKGGRNHWDFKHHSDTENPKSAAVVANFLKGVPYNVLVESHRSKCPFWSCDFQNESPKFHDDCADDDGSYQSYQGENYPTSIVRKFSPIECERLQTLPDNYTAGVSNTQRYKMLGNGWTVDVIAHIFKHLL